jgi:DNA-binding response OmpR family regulator
VKVLVVDDDLELASLIAYALRQPRYLVVEAHDGLEALAAAARESPDLVVLDVNLPRLGGLDVLRRLRATPGTSATPILLLTVRAAEEDQVLGLDLGADDYMAKPFSPRTLLARVRALPAAPRRRQAERPGRRRSGPRPWAAERHVDSQPPVRLTPLELRLLQNPARQCRSHPARRALPPSRLGARGSEDRQLLKQLGAPPAAEDRSRLPHTRATS